MGIWNKIIRILRRGQSSSPQPDLLEQRPCPHLGRLEIPTELILMIAEHLDKPSLLSLALTCRTLYCYCFPKSFNLSSSEKREFLLLLEKDAANYYFCHYCIELHPWHTRWFDDRHSLGRDFYSKDVMNHCKMKNWFSRFSLHVPYPLARVVMNRHFYGTAHGVPADKLADRGVLIHPRGRVTCSRAWEARIIDDQLMFSSIINVGPLRDSKGLSACIDAGLASVCDHITTNALFPRHQIPELVMHGSQLDYFAQHLQSVNSCPICMTDYCIDISWQEQGWAIEIITYHVLGDARSPWNWAWIAMAYLPDEAVKVPRYKQPSGNQPGIVRHMWSKSDDLVFEPEGEWAKPIPPYYRRYMEHEFESRDAE